MIKTPEKAQPLSYEINTDDLAGGQGADSRCVGRGGIQRSADGGGGCRKDAPGAADRVTDGYQQIRRLIILRGRYFDFADMKREAKFA